MEQQKRDLSFYWKLFYATLTLSAFTFGGGYVIVPLMKERFVDDYHWIDEEEMMDLVAISQSSPGPLAINASILVGYRMAGVVGALITILATALPPLVIITIVSYFYEAFRSSPIVDAALKGMQAGVSAVILNVIYTMAGNVIKQKDALAIGIMVAAFAATYIFKINVMFVVLACEALGVALSLSRKPGKEGE